MPRARRMSAPTSGRCFLACVVAAALPSCGGLVRDGVGSGRGAAGAGAASGSGDAIAGGGCFDTIPFSWADCEGPAGGPGPSGAPDAGSAEGGASGDGPGADTGGGEAGGVACPGFPAGPWAKCSKSGDESACAVWCDNEKDWVGAKCGGNGECVCAAGKIVTKVICTCSWSGSPCNVCCPGMN